jgi:hypothetical protein
MGYCYQGRKLCCDFCGHAGARKVPCPFGYCQADAVCNLPACKTARKDKMGRAAHRARGCEQRHAAFVEDETLTAAMIEADLPVRCAALNQDGHGVQVLFRTKDGSCVGRYMSAEVYRALPGMEAYTMLDYENIAGHPLEVAPGDFDGPTTKQVA